VGDGASTEIAVEHKLGTKHVVTNVYESTAPFAEVIPTVEITDENHVTLIFLTAPSLDQYVVVVVSGGGGGGGEPEAWKALELFGSWVSYGSGYRAAQYRKNQLGQVELRGVISGGGAGHCADLPEGYWPAEQEQFGTAYGLVNVAPSGEVYCVVAAFAALNGVTFWTT
jgi:hypothetical protein